MKRVLQPLIKWARVNKFTSFDFTGDIDGRGALKNLSSNDFGNITFGEITIRLTNLSSIDENAFADNTLITWKLSLPYNLLTEQVFVVTSKFKKLQVLRLSYNSIEKIPATAFTADQRELHKIDLAFNNITAIGNEAFAHLPNLEEIILNNNKIKMIGSNAFMPPGTSANNRLLLVVNLEVNFLTSRSFRSSSLTGSRKVKLNLAVNRVTVLSENVFKQIFDAGGSIDMKQNPMTCDCGFPSFLIMVATDKCLNCNCANGTSVHDLSAAALSCPVSAPAFRLCVPEDRVFPPSPRSETDSLQP